MIDIVAELQQDNPRARLADLQVYANALRIYREASANIEENGAICSHPRTGTPIDNPYLKVQAQQGAILLKMRKINSDRVVTMLQAEADPEP